jgi:hypothetical protein
MSEVIARTLQFEAFQAWCESDLHGRRGATPDLCVRIGNIAICEGCLYQYGEDLEEARIEWQDVRRHRRDLLLAVESAEEIVSIPTRLL